MKWIYLSPHFDDAVLSCGGLISYQSQNGLPVEIWNITSGIPTIEGGSALMKMIQEQWGIDSPREAVLERRKEDHKAAARVGATTLGFDQLDCIYRNDGQGQYYYNSIFDPIHPDEVNLPHQIADWINNQAGRDDIIVLPLAVGGHIDHIIARKAAEFIEIKTLFYIDIPYFFKDETILDTIRGQMTEKNVHFSFDHLRVWTDAIMDYTSQISSLFDGRSDLEAKLSRYYNKFSGLSLWQMPIPPAEEE